jgi:flagellin
MRIADNLVAMDTYRNYNINNQNVAKAAEELSSGYKINSASDDAAGLAISEKMQTQIAGLNMASQNSQNGVSMLQTADGALSSVQDMLQRMNELAVESSNGTNQDFDRSAISSEYDQLKSEIDQVSQQTTFNNINLLDGNIGSSGTAVLQSNYDDQLTAGATQAFAPGDTISGATTGAAAMYSVKDSSGITNTNGAGTYTISMGDLSTAGAFTHDTSSSVNDVRVQFAGNDGSTKTYDIALTDAVKGNNYTQNQQTFTLDLSGAGLGTQTLVYNGTAANNTSSNLAQALDGAQVTTTTGNFKESAAGTMSTALTDISGSFTGQTAGSYNVTQSGANLTFTNETTGASKTVGLLSDGSAGTADLSSVGLGTLSYTNPATAGALTTAETAWGAVGNFSVDGTPNSGTAGGGLTIQTGANQGESLNISIANMSTAGLGLSTSSIDTQDGAGTAITATQNAINTVSSQRAVIGALENRLNYKVSNLNTASENLTSANSTIKDVDIAQEMTTYTKDNIMAQAATSMLAQANALPQNVLKLLQ